MDAIHFEQIAKELAFWKEKHEETRGLAQSTASRVVLAITKQISLRELARRTGKSSTYLSHISSDKARCSDETYIELVEGLKSLASE